jgi:mono/diheme cytochrome c family protein
MRHALHYGLGAAALAALAVAINSCSTAKVETSTPESRRAINAHGSDLIDEGRKIFRYDTFGSEAFWEKTRLHDAIAGEKNGGVGPGLSPNKALELGLKVDVQGVPSTLIPLLRAGTANLDDPAVTLALLKGNAVVGVTGFFEPDGKKLKAVGIQCALCHSTVDDGLKQGIGGRLDGWANRDLNIGAIVALAPDLSAFEKLLQVDQATVRKVLTSWGPGKYDAQLNVDGKAFRPDGKPAATLIPSAFGLAGVNNHTWTGSWGTVTYWNAYVANLQMYGQGTFYDPRLNDPGKYPVAARNKLWNKQAADDKITAKLPALHMYQLSLPTPKPLAGSFDKAAAGRGEAIFKDKARCATCHVPPLFTEPGENLHTGKEIGIDEFQASRSPGGRYRTEPLRALWDTKKIHKGGFYHDGRFASLADVVNHYDRHFGTRLTEQEKADLIEYLRTL